MTEADETNEEEAATSDVGDEAPAKRSEHRGTGKAGAGAPTPFARRSSTTAVADTDEEKTTKSEVDDKAPAKRSRLRRATAAVAAGAAAFVRLFVRRPWVTVTVLGVCTVLFGAATAWLWVTNADRDAVEGDRAAALSVAKEKTAAVLSYNHKSFDADFGTALSGLTGQFREDYKKMVKDVVKPAVRRQELVTETQVVGDAVTKAEDGRVEALLFLNQTTKGKGAKQPAFTGSRVNVVLEEVDGRWLISSLKPL